MSKQIYHGFDKFNDMDKTNMEQVKRAFLPEIKRSNDILKLIDAIGDGHHVYSGMVHQNRAIAYLTQALGIADEIEKREYQNAKRIDELNHIVESDKFQYQSLCDKYYSEKDRANSLTAENQLLSERVKELKDLEQIISDQEIASKYKVSISADQYFLMKHEITRVESELSALRKAYSELKAEKETVKVNVRCGRCKEK